MSVLEDMLEKAKAELASAQKAEMNSAFDFKMLKQKLEDAIAFGEKTLAETKKAKAAAEEAKAVAEGELETASGEAAAARPRSRRCSRSRQPACTCWRRCATRASRPRARTPSSLGRAVRRWRAALSCPLACRAARAHDAARACGCCGMGR